MLLHLCLNYLSVSLFDPLEVAQRLLELILAIADQYLRALDFMFNLNHHRWDNL